MPIPIKNSKDMTLSQVAQRFIRHYNASLYLAVVRNRECYINTEHDMSICELEDGELVLWYARPDQERVARALVELFEALYSKD